MRIIGAVASGEDPTPDEYQDGLEYLNEMFAAWSLKPNMLPDAQSRVAALPSPQYQYIVAPGADIAWPTPSDIDYLILIDSAGTRFTVDPRSRQDIMMHRTSNIVMPTRYHFDGIAILFPSIVPSGFALEVYAQWPLPQIEDINDTVDLPKAHLRMARLGLALELAAEYAPDMLAVSAARFSDARSGVTARAASKRSTEMRVDELSPGAGFYDIMSGP